MGARPDYTSAIRPADLLRCIRNGIDSTNGIAESLGFSSASIHNRLHEMKAGRQVHQVRRRADSGRFMRWVEGCDPALMTDEELTAQVRIVSVEYDAINRRDPLVAALFGAPKASNEQISVGAA